MTTKNRLRAKVKPFAELMGAIGDVHRMSMLYLLAHGPLDAWQITEYTGLSSSLTTHHLNILFHKNWVTKKKYGKRVEYSLNGKSFFELQKLFKDTEVGREVWKA